MEACIQPDRTPDANRAPDAALLIVDDDEHVRRALKRVVKRSGCRLHEAADAAEALTLLACEPVHVIVSDYRMPGMSGVEFLRIVKERWPRTQRVLLTGQADTAAIEEAVNQSEIFRFIWKPWDDSHLLLTVQSAIDQYWLVEENARLSDLLTERNAELELVNRELDRKLEARSRALTRAADEWRTCFDAIADPLAVLRADGAVVRGNTAFARTAGVEVNRLPALRCDGGGFGPLPCAHADGPHLIAAPGSLELVRNDRTWLVNAFPFTDGGSVV